MRHHCSGRHKGFRNDNFEKPRASRFPGIQGPKKNKKTKQQFDFSFEASGKIYTCRTSEKRPSVRSTLVVGSNVNYEIDGIYNGKLEKSAAGKEVKCTIVRVATICPPRNRLTRPGGPFKPFFGLSGALRMGRVSSRSFSLLSCPCAFNLNSPCAARRILAKTAPLPALCALAQPAIHRLR